MNIIFTDFDGTFYTYPDYEGSLEKRVKTLADFCKKTNSKVVIESASKELIDENTLELKTQDCAWIVKLMSLFKKYGIEIYGVTPKLKAKYSYNKHSNSSLERFANEYYKTIEYYEECKYMNDSIKEDYEYYLKKYPKLSDYLNCFKYSKVDIWKEDEIRIYLMRHPEIKHYAVLDDDDNYSKYSDLNKVRNHLVKVKNYTRECPVEQLGLLDSHEEELTKILQQDNEVRNYVLRMAKKRNR